MNKRDADKLTKQTVKNYSLGGLCSLLAEANVHIYEYENKKWHGRVKKSTTSNEIDQWDLASRTWNEKRSMIKNQIDIKLKHLLINNSSISNSGNNLSSFQILPISLMIDMLTIENIKIYDLTIKKKSEQVKKAQSRKKALQISINDFLAKIIKEGGYNLEEEVRTF